MADHHTEEILNLLKQWQSLVNQESDAISKDNIQDVGEMIKQSSLILQRLEHLLGASGSTKQDDLISEMINGLHKQQEIAIQALKGQTDTLAQHIGALRRNKTSLMGYKQNKTLPPRFKSERT